MQRNLVVAGFSLLVCYLSTGSIPNVAWLPDSSGFVFTETLPKEAGKLRLVHYDIAKKERKVLVGDLEDAYTIWPAVSPDGKQIAVARFRWQQNVAKCQLVIYDFAGKEVRATKEIDWVQVGPFTVGTGWDGYLFWASPNIVLVGGVARNIRAQTAVIDLQSEKVVLVKERFPFALCSTPCRPDGKGFLGMVDGRIDRLAFIEWDGKQTTIEWKAGWRYEVALDFRWDGVNAVLVGLDETATLDTATGKVTYQKSPPLVDPGRPKELLFSRIVFADNHLEFREFGLEDRADILCRLEIRDLKSGKTRVLREKTAGGLVFPSPDRKWVTMRTDDTIVLVDAKGEIVAEVPAAFCSN